MRLLTFSGWAQAPMRIFENAQPFEYSECATIEEVYDRVASMGHFDAVAGWSLGGQLALRALSEKALSADALVLLGTPYQWRASADYPEGVSEKDTDDTMRAFQRDPQVFLDRFQRRIALGDAKARTVRDGLSLATERRHLEYWLHQLMTFSCDDVDVRTVPGTFVVHGCDDAVIAPIHARHFSRRLTKARVETIERVGHAPHLHPEIVGVVAQWLAEQG